MFVIFRANVANWLPFEISRDPPTRAQGPGGHTNGPEQGGVRGRQGVAVYGSGGRGEVGKDDSILLAPQPQSLNHWHAQGHGGGGASNGGAEGLHPTPQTLNPEP